ncbi:MAG: DUF4160 domain-containing protein [Chloroflexota bacterium]|nr:MAG: DUF4160 domain-containing protein [Chloroflexota bacterium]
MPTILIEGYKFQFYSSDEKEPPHVHVLRGGSVAKIWLGTLVVEYNYGYNNAELNKILKLTRENQARLLRRWNEHFGPRKS